MKIAVNAQLLSNQESYRGAGVSNYSRELLHALGELVRNGAAPHDITAYVHARQPDLDGIEQSVTSLPLERPAARIAWEQSVLPVHLRRSGAALIHGLVNVLPLAAPCPGVVTVHDLSFVRTPEKLPPLKRAYHTALCRASVARAARVIAVSHQTAADLQQYWATPAGRIRVAHNGVSPRFTPQPPERIAALRRQNDLPERYLLYLGTLEPRKNLDLLLHAFARWVRESATAVDDVALVLAGARGWYYDEIFRTVTALGLAGRVHFPGFVPAADLPAWYAGAEAFVYPSLFEGFGLPVLEAMACGVPVICSRVPSLLEVAGDAAITVAPDDEAGFAHALRLVLEQPRLCSALRKRGLVQAARFSWRRSAEQTLAIYEEIARLRR